MLERLDSVGVMLRGLNLSSFDDWMSEAASGETPSLGLASMFVPIARVERIFLDEQIGMSKATASALNVGSGVTVTSYLGLPELDESVKPS